MSEQVPEPGPTEVIEGSPDVELADDQSDELDEEAGDEVDPA